MILSETLEALSNNTNVNITLTDNQDIQLITFNAAGYEVIESDLGSRRVKSLKINSSTSVTVSLKEADNSNPSGDPSDPSDPSSDPTGDP